MSDYEGGGPIWVRDFDDYYEVDDDDNFDEILDNDSETTCTSSVLRRSGRLARPVRSALIGSETLLGDKEQDAEGQRRDAQLDEMGDLRLLSGEATSLFTLFGSAISAVDYRWAKHQAEQTLGHAGEGDALERALGRGLLSLGKTYAINRYATWERVSRPAALTATLPFGFRALLDRYLLGEGLGSEPGQRALIGKTLQQAKDSSGITAYRRAGLVQALIHTMASTALPEGPLSLDRERTREILALARLRFSVAELEIGSFNEMGSLRKLYQRERAEEQSGAHEFWPVRGRKIRNWRMRHLHSLVFLFPDAVRHALARGIKRFELTSAPFSVPLDRAIAVNELTIAHCSIILMRRRAPQKRGLR